MLVHLGCFTCDITYVWEWSFNYFSLCIYFTELLTWYHFFFPQAQYVSLFRLPIQISLAISRLILLPQVLRALSTQVLKTCKDGDSMTILGNVTGLSHSFYTIKKKVKMYNVCNYGDSYLKDFISSQIFRKSKLKLSLILLI